MVSALRVSSVVRGVGGEMFGVGMGVFVVKLVVKVLVV